MNEHDLFSAIGNSDDAFLLETEQPPVRRLPRRLGLIAAMLAVAVLTACAAPVVIRTFNALTGGSAEQTQKMQRVREMITDPETGDIISITEREWSPAEYKITLEITADPNAPDTIAEYYAPTFIPEGYTCTDYHYESEPLKARYATESTAYLFGTFIEFQQRILPEGDPVVFTDTFERFHSLFIQDMGSLYATYGEAQVLELAPQEDAEYFTVSIGSFIQASRYLYWSDGRYIFRLEVPYEMDDDTITQIIASVQPIEDPSAYPVPSE